MQTDQSGATLNEAALGEYNQGSTASCPPPPVLGFQLQSLRLSFLDPFSNLGFTQKAESATKAHIQIVYFWIKS